MRLCFSPDGTTVAIAGQKHGTSTINLATGRTQRFPAPLSNSVAISRDNLLATDDLSEVLIWDLRKEHWSTQSSMAVSVLIRYQKTCWPVRIGILTRWEVPGDRHGLFLHAPGHKTIRPQSLASS